VLSVLSSLDKARLHKALSREILRDPAQRLLHRPAPLSVASVFSTLRAIAEEKGQGAASRRQRLVVGLLRRCR
jgi:ATP-dependent DNA ligase